MTSGAGPAMFARFAYPPNALGLCGPDDHAALLQASSEVTADACDEIRHLATGFAGAWPYLQLIAAANGIDDPLDARVVAAYWIGSDLLQAVPATWLADHAEGRFRQAAGRGFDQVVGAVLAGGRPHHNFHVFGVSPWVGLLRGDTTGAPLRVLDQCRVRVGTVLAVAGERATVATTTLRWDGQDLLPVPVTQDVRWQVGGYSLGERPEAGSAVAMHWDWICQPLAPSQAAALAGWSDHHLRMANAVLEERTIIGV
jgi:hypothetical protein